MPRRVQLRRTKGWRKPDNVVVVARPTKWGNSFRPGVDGDRAACVARFRDALQQGQLAITVGDACRELRGHDLACWCALDEVCHADVLLELANGLPA